MDKNLLLFIFLVPFSVSASEFFITRNLTTAVGRRSRFRLTCTSEAPYVRIFWEKDGVPLRNSKRIFGSQGTTLCVHEVKKVDKGMYVCKIVYDKGTSKGRFFVDVQEAPSFITEPTSKEVEMGKTVSIPCKVSGIPKPVVHWLNNDGVSPSRPPRVTITGDGTLVIKRFSQNDAGLYTCVSRNVHGSARKQILLYAKNNDGQLVTPLRTLTYYNKAPQFNRLPNVHNVLDAGLDHMISCSAQGDPTPNVTIGRLNKVGKKAVGNVMLVFKNASVEDTGQYECQARNYYGAQRYVFALRFKIDGGFSTWSPWSKCSRECGQGTQYRTRKCNSPKPSKGGRSCYGRYTERKNCLNKACIFPKITMILYDVRDVNFLKMECAATGFPKPKLQWKFNSRLLPYRGNKISIPKKFARRGSYICEAKSVLGYATYYMQHRP